MPLSFSISVCMFVCVYERKIHLLVVLKAKLGLGLQKLNKINVKVLPSSKILRFSGSNDN